MLKMKKVIVAIAALAAFCHSDAVASPYNFQLFPRTAHPLASQLFRHDAAADSAAVDETLFDEWGFPINDDAEPAADEAEWLTPGEAELRYAAPMSRWFFTPAVYDTYIYSDSLFEPRAVHGLPAEAESVYRWIDDYSYNRRLMNQLQRRHMIVNPDWVSYNAADLPEPPAHYRATIDPFTTQLVLVEERPKVTASQATDIKLDFERKNWLTTFNASVQFSQAYVSPNWYQGGNNNLNMLANIFYNIKLNEAFHKNLLFETTFQYKLGLNSAPDDSLRNYSISEDLLQLTSKLGLRAAKRWYYSLALNFKTQALNSYTSNTRNLKSAFLSPGELNVGAGMTYDYANPKKTFTFNASISPISWNMKMCYNNRMNPQTFGIKEGHHTVNNYGSSTECKLMWKMAYNISYSSRLFAFTDYDYFQGDWEHTLSFDINRFLSTQIYAHMRYDTTTGRISETNRWHKFQFKEILSFGFSYKFATKN